MATHVYGVLQRWIDAQKIPPTQAQMARLLGVSRGTITNWKTGTVPKPAQVDRIVERTDIGKQELLTAVLQDQGYLRVDSWEPVEEVGSDAAATNRAGGSPAEKESPTKPRKSRHKSRETRVAPARPKLQRVALPEDQ